MSASAGSGFEAPKLAAPKASAELSPVKRALLARRLGLAAATQAPQVGAAISRRSTPFPLASFAQQAIWLIEQRNPGSPLYNVAQKYRFRGALDVGALERACAGVVRRHEVLRTRFVFDNSELRQHIDDVVVPLRRVDLRGTPSAADVEAVLVAEARQLFDLARGSPMRTTLFQIAESDYVLLLVVHHAVIDGWSIPIWWNEVKTLYEAYTAGRPSPLPPLQVQYADFSEWERNELNEERLAPLLAYWRKQLGERLVPLDLPTDHARPAQPSFAGRCVTLCTDPKLLAALQPLIERANVTMFMAILAALKVVLHRYTGAGDIAVCVPVTTRSLPETQDLIGLFVNTIVLRDQISAEMPFEALLASVRDTVLAGLSNRDLPFGRLLRDWHKAGGLVDQGPFSVFFSTITVEQSGLALGGLAVSTVGVHTNTSKFDLSVFADETPDGLKLIAEYSTDLFEAARIERLLGHLHNVLVEAAGRPQVRLSEIALLGAAERHLLLSAWNATARDYARDACLHELFAQQARRTPDAVALVFKGATLTYGELNCRADELSGCLRAHGVGPDVLVGLCVERGFEMVVGILGILKAGGAYLPIDPAFPADRIAFMLEDSHAPVLVTQRSLNASLPEGAAVRVYLDEPLPLVNDRPMSKPPNSTNLAYVIYTSGSTGQPKGVQIEHRAVVNFLNAMRREPGLVPEDVVLAVTTLSFDIAGLELHLPLTTGARIVIAPWEDAVDGEMLLQTINQHKVTVLQATPATWRLLLAAGWKGTPGLRALCGGEAMPADLVEQLLPRCDELWNMYGPTETTIWSTCSRVTSAQDIHIGRPIDNTRVYILDAHHQPLPVGLAGELLIGGDGLARGYLNRPELTAAKFISNPFGEGRVYRTGDLARWREDGTIECLGRIDCQVKLRGFRIELGEIEATLAKVPEIEQAVVVLRDEQLVAYLIPAVADHRDAAFISALRERLRKLLPEYMVPARFAFLEHFPLTPNGKIDRKALQAVAGDAVMATSSAFEAPSTETERQLVAIWERVLQRSPIGIRDNFFDLGGHSLLAVELFADIERELGRKLPLATLFSLPTVAGIASLFKPQAQPLVSWRSLVPIQTGGTKLPLFMVHGAGGNILLYRDLAGRLGPDQPVYGFQSRGLDGRTKALDSVEAMAEAYLAELKAFRPQGPYLLGGYCMGGLVALEMAQLLKGQGEDVPLVALLDTYNPAKVGKSNRFAAILQRGKFHLRNLAQLGPRHLGRYLGEKLRVARDGEWSNLVGSHDNPPQNGSVSSAGLGEIPGGKPHLLQRINDQAAAAYRPKDYGGSIIIFKPQINYSFFPDTHLGWKGIADQGVVVVELPINPHAMLVEPFVVHLADALRFRMEQIGIPVAANQP